MRNQSPPWDRDSRIALSAVIVALLGSLVSFFQWRSAKDQLDVMTVQTEQMIAQQRPWLSAVPRLEHDFVYWSGPSGRDISIPLTFDIANHGPSPAVNIRVMSQALVVEGVTNAVQLSAAQTGLCDAARSNAREVKGAGVAIFPGETKVVNSGISVGHDVPKPEGLTFYIVQGCIDYTFSGGHHGRTAYRMYLGKINEETHLWDGIPFVAGTEPFEGGGGTMISRVSPKGYDFRETDDGGNWAE